MTLLRRRGGGRAGHMPCPSCRQAVDVQAGLQRVSEHSAQPAAPQAAAARPAGEEEEEAVEGDYGTKIEAVVRLLRRILRGEGGKGRAPAPAPENNIETRGAVSHYRFYCSAPRYAGPGGTEAGAARASGVVEGRHDKAIVFSLWGDVLGLIAMALTQNGIRYAAAHGPCARLHVFKNRGRRSTDRQCTLPVQSARQSGHRAPTHGFVEHTRPSPSLPLPPSPPPPPPTRSGGPRQGGRCDRGVQALARRERAAAAGQERRQRPEPH